MATARAGVLRSPVYIVDGVRTTIGKFGRSLKDFKAVDLAALTIRELLERAGVDPNYIELAVYGHVIRAGTHMNTAKQAALKAGLRSDLEGFNVDMVCASGMASVVKASLLIDAGMYSLALAGGMESMSNAPFIAPPSIRWGVRLIYQGALEMKDAMVNDGLYDPLNQLVMGQEADETAWDYGAPREELDWIAYESNMRAARAWERGHMQKYTIPVKAGGGVVLDYDEGIRPDTTVERLSKLPPVFTPKGPHTAGNSSQISDGAVSLLVASEEAVREMGLKPKARIVGWAYAGVDPRRFPVAPVHAVRALLKKLGWRVEDVDYWENNEAFAVNSLIMNRELGVPYERLNVVGGSIAVGHPLGSTGARLILQLVYTLEENGARRGVASICHGLGGAAAVAIERV
ncbi:acetyl-CoA C-acyltransferase [Aeropyrum pernix]|uniref:acetyl-CoA C-acyltransferase n=1 Tax=Aeropyrum pernix TaxID=56636 RepID=UPI0010374D0F|nr:acetyl-CoA C-acyltransferase [Aeropyrum pernix]